MAQIFSEHSGNLTNVTVDVTSPRSKDHGMAVAPDETRPFDQNCNLLGSYKEGQLVGVSVVINQGIESMPAVDFSKLDQVVAGMNPEDAKLLQTECEALLHVLPHLVAALRKHLK